MQLANIREQTQIGKLVHEVPVQEVARQLETDATTGLTQAESAARLQRYGRNALTQARQRSAAVRFLLQFNQPLVYILLAAAAVTFALREFVDSGVIMGVVLVNAVIGFVQEAKALKAIEALARTMTNEATVVREGSKMRIDAGDLVPGDVVFIQAGDKVPADARLVSAGELQVDESALTGESLPVAKGVDPVPADAVLADRRNMVYSSTLVTYGSALAIVTGTGDRTEIGRISKMLETEAILSTPLTRKIAQFSKLLLWLILAFAAVTFVVGILRNQNWVEMFTAAVALAVGAIPEGLPAAITITLAIGASRMASRHAIIRRLPAVETLGSTTVICSDKTGTLTQNEMTVCRVMAGGTTYGVTGQGYAPYGQFEIVAGPAAPQQNSALGETILAGVLANDAWLQNEDGRWKVEGDPTEGALLVAGHKFGLPPSEAETRFPRLSSIPFDSSYQYMATLHPLPGGQQRVYLKGATEAILSRCGWAMNADGSLASLDKTAAESAVADLAAQGLRVLAFARIDLAAASNAISHTDVAEGLVLLGFQGMSDPPRPEAIRAVGTCQRAGIGVKMITGDHAATALAISRRIGLSTPGGDLSVLTGRQLEQLGDEEMVQAAAATTVFARVTPEQKLRLVRALQARGGIVAMTGDGVNDAPALRRADIGVSMGVAGTAVAQEASDMVLADDNFASIEAAVEEGRAVFDNLVKFITWTLPTNVGEGMVILAAVFAGATLPILPVQLLWINMTTAVFLGLMLAFEPKEAGIMERPPRDPSRPILTRVLQIRIALVSLLLLICAFGLFEWALAQGMTLAEARTVAVNVFVMGELAYLFNCRSLTRSAFSLGFTSNPLLLGGVGAMIAFQLLFTYASPLNRAFQSAPIGWAAWGAIIAAALSIHLAVFAEKALRRRYAGVSPGLDE